MRQGQSKRMRGRTRKGPNPLSRTYESNGPDVKIRGTASHIADKYVQLARDSQSSGDPVAAENYFQHAEHYYRIVAAAQPQFQPQQPGFSRGNDDGRDEDGDDEEDFEGEMQAPGFNGSQEQPFAGSSGGRAPYESDRPRQGESGGQRDQGQRDQGQRDQGQRDQGQRDQGQRYEGRPPQDDRNRPRYDSRSGGDNRGNEYRGGNDNRSGDQRPRNDDQRPRYDSRGNGGDQQRPRYDDQRPPRPQSDDQRSSRPQSDDQRQPRQDDYRPRPEDQRARSDDRRPAPRPEEGRSRSDDRHQGSDRGREPRAAPPAPVFKEPEPEAALPAFITTPTPIVTAPVNGHEAAAAEAPARVPATRRRRYKTAPAEAAAETAAEPPAAIPDLAGPGGE